MSPLQRNLFGLMGIATLGLLFFLSSTANNTTASQSGAAESSVVTKELEEFQKVQIETGKTTHDIPFYHCHHPSANQQKKYTELVLLHGARFTKEDWKTSGILELFCESNKELSVTALDLSVRAPYTKLLETLQDLKQDGHVHKLPIAGLVTPSASGYSVLSGIAPAAGEKTDSAAATKQLKEAIQRWIPVASNGVLSVDSQALKDNIKDWPILAMYGDQDQPGKKSSKLLLSTAGAAKIQEIKGRHPCYLDSPKDFVEKVVSFVGLDSMKKEAQDDLHVGL